MSKIKNILKRRVLSTLLASVGFVALLLLAQTNAVLAATAPSLGVAQSFGVLGASAVTSTDVTVITGDLGIWPNNDSSVTGFPPGIYTGTLHAADGVALQAQSDLTTAYNALSGQACNLDKTGQDLGGLTLTPGVYCFSSSAQLTGTLTLNAQGDANAVWIFQIGSTLTTASNSSVLMINGGSDCNVFWQIGSSATLGTDTAFIGNILAYTSITLTTRATVSGRALALHGAVTMDTNNVSLEADCVKQQQCDEDTYIPPDLRPWVAFQDNNGGSINIQQDCGGFFEYICATDFPVDGTLKYKGTVHIPQGDYSNNCQWAPAYTFNGCFDLIITIQYLVSGQPSEQIIKQDVHNGDVFDFEVPLDMMDTTKIGDLVHVGVMFYACGSNFGIYACAPQALDINNDCPTAITLASFTATPKSKKVILEWTTGDETDNLGFNVYRAAAKDGEYVKLNPSLILSKAGTGPGTTYEFVDSTAKNGTAYFYKLEDVDINGVKTLHGPERATPRWIFGIFGK